MAFGWKLQGFQNFSYTKPLRVCIQNWLEFVYEFFRNSMSFVSQSTELCVKKH